MDNQKNEVSITLNRETIVNTSIAVLLGLLVILGWQVYTLKASIDAELGTEKIAKAQPLPSGDTGLAPTPSQATVAAVSDSDYVRGNAKAKISLIEYSDYECPFCERFHPTAQQAVDEFNGEVNWVFRHFPLSFHPGSQKKAEAAECAGDLAGSEAFWSLTDTLFADQSLSVSQLAVVATSIGIEKGAFQECLDSGRMNAKVQASLAGGESAGVTGTPGTFVYNNETGESILIPGALPYTQLEQAITQLLNS